MKTLHAHSMNNHTQQIHFCIRMYRMVHHTCRGWNCKQIKTVVRNLRKLCNKIPNNKIQRSAKHHQIVGQTPPKNQEKKSYQLLGHFPPAVAMA